MSKTLFDGSQKNFSSKNARNEVGCIQSENLLDLLSLCQGSPASDNSKGSSTAAGIDDADRQRREHAANIVENGRQEHLFVSNFAARAELARESAMKVSPEQLRLLPLAQAAEVWFEQLKKPTLTKEKTIVQYELYLR